MSSAAIPIRITPEDLFRIPDGQNLELVDGELVEKPMSAFSSRVGGLCYNQLENYCQSTNAGWAYPDATSYQCFAFAPKLVRKPDASFIRLDRLTDEQAYQVGHIPVVPDLTVEVISPNDGTYDLDRKIEEFLRAGTTVIWVINPDTKQIRAHRKDGIRVFHETDVLEAEDVLPGFRCRVSDLFKVPRRS